MPNRPRRHGQCAVVAKVWFECEAVRFYSDWENQQGLGLGKNTQEQTSFLLVPIPDVTGAVRVTQRRHGQSVDAWIVSPTSTRLEMEAQDENVVISNKQTASKVLKGATFAPPFSAGVLDPDRVDTVL